MSNPKNSAAAAFVLLVWITLMLLLAAHVYKNAENAFNDFKFKTVDEMINGSSQVP